MAITRKYCTAVGAARDSGPEIITHTRTSGGAISLITAVVEATVACSIVVLVALGTRTRSCGGVSIGTVGDLTISTIIRIQALTLLGNCVGRSPILAQGGTGYIAADQPIRRETLTSSGTVGRIVSAHDRVANQLRTIRCRGVREIKSAVRPTETHRRRDSVVPDAIVQTRVEADVTARADVSCVTCAHGSVRLTRIPLIRRRNDERELIKCTTRTVTIRFT